MMTPQELLDQAGIHLNSYAAGEHTSICPQCSAKRKPHHQNLKCLGVKIDDRGATWHCNHCDWTGPEKGTGQGNGGLDPHDDRNFVAKYDYSGFQKVRYPKGHKPRFLIRHRNGNRWEWGAGNADTSVLYHKDEIEESIALERTILVCEGEKDVENCRKHRIPATCNAHGASEPDKTPKWRIEHSEQLRGADIVVIPDHDPAGYAHANTVCRLSLGIAKRVRFLKLIDHWPECPEGGDVSDWLDAGHTREELDALIEQAPDWTPPRVTEAPLILVDWLKRDLPSPDLILPWLSTTSRVQINAPTGTGKTMLGVGLCMGMSAGRGFLHWLSIRPARTLLIDGEMSRRLLQQRLAAEADRLGVTPEGMHILSHEDIEGFAPLNTPEGQAQIEQQIKRIGTLDLILFDSVMCLISGDQKDEEGWRNTLPWIRSLTRRCIGQIWLHHTGHDEQRGYGTKTREWTMDTVLHMEEAKRADTDVSFQLSFRKARERTPANRTEFADCKIALLNNRWTSEQVKVSVKAKVSPLGKKFYGALVNATIDSDAKKMFNCPTATIEHWRAECIKIGLLDKDKPKSASALFSKHKRELIAANKVACNETIAWTL
jgi:hypothetical protein